MSNKYKYARPNARVGFVGWIRWLLRCVQLRCLDYVDAAAVHYINEEVDSKWRDEGSRVSKLSRQTTDKYTPDYFAIPATPCRRRQTCHK